MTTKYDYSDFRDDIATVYSTNPNAIILGHELDDFEDVPVWTILDRGDVLTVGGGPGTGSMHLPKTIMVALTEFTNRHVCLFSQTNYASLDVSPSTRVVNASKKMANKKILKALNSGRYDVVIVDNHEEWRNVDRNEFLLALAESGAAIVFIRSTGKVCDVEFREQHLSSYSSANQGDYEGVPFVPYWVPLGEKLPNYMMQAYEKQVEEAAAKIFLKRNFRLASYSRSTSLRHSNTFFECGTNNSDTLTAALGVDSENTIYGFEFTHRTPRLTIAVKHGGKGKTWAVRNILAQLMSNNGPSVLQVALMCTEIYTTSAFDKYRHVRHSINLVDSLNSGNLAAETQNIYFQLEQEINRRILLFDEYRSLGFDIQCVEDARSIGTKQMSLENIFEHELNLPAIMVVEDINNENLTVKENADFKRSYEMIHEVGPEYGIYSLSTGNDIEACGVTPHLGMADRYAPAGLFDLKVDNSAVRIRGFATPEDVSEFQWERRGGYETDLDWHLRDAIKHDVAKE